MELTVDNPFQFATPWEWLGGIAAGAITFYAAWKKWARSEHAESRREGAEDRKDGAYDDVIAIMRQQIRDSTLDRAKMRDRLDQCEQEHANCRSEMKSLRERVDGLENR